MGLEDLSLDEIIKERKAAKKKANKPNSGEMYSDAASRPNPLFQKKRLFIARKQQQQQQQKQGKIVDARFLIKSKTKITDARQKIKPKAIVDARQKIEAKHNQGFKRTSPQKAAQLTGKIPKVTISNELALKKPHQNPSITFHVTQGTKTRATFDSLRKNRNSGHTVNQNQRSGIKIAVKNEFAVTRPNPRFQPLSPKKTFEKLKITTLNKDAIRRKPLPPKQPTPPPPPPSPPTRSIPIRKRSLPAPESDDSFEEPPVYTKQRRQQRAEPREEPEKIYRSTPPMPRQHSKPDTSTLRPMISRQTSTRPVPIVVEDEIPLGPSPIEGTKLRVFNLHPVVTEDDILELFSVLGAVRRARLVKPGEAEVVYIKHDNAFAAFKKYNNRDLDGQPMEIKLMTNETPRQTISYSWMKEVKSSRKKPDIGEVTELHGGVLQQALFKGGSTGTSTRPVVFTVKI